MTNPVISKGSRVRLCYGLAVLVAVLIAGYFAPERRGDLALELVWLKKKQQRLAFATDAEVKRWQERTATADAVQGSIMAALETTLGHPWQRRPSEYSSGSIRFTRQAIEQNEWPSVLATLHRLDSIAGLTVERVIVITNGGLKRMLIVEIVLRLENAEPIAFGGRLPVLGRMDKGKLAASWGGSCARPRPVLGATPTIRFSGLCFC